MPTIVLNSKALGAGSAVILLLLVLEFSVFTLAREESIIGI